MSVIAEVSTWHGQSLGIPHEDCGGPIVRDDNFACWVCFRCFHQWRDEDLRAATGEAEGE